MNDTEIISFLRQENETLRARNRELEDALVGVTELPFEWALTPSEARLMSTLINRKSLTTSGAMAVLYDDLGKDRPDEKIVDVLICKIRKKVKPFNVSIHTVWGEGYFIPEDQRRELKKTLDGEQEVGK